MTATIATQNKLLIVHLEAKEVIIVTSERDERLYGKCLACNASGWLKNDEKNYRNGFPSGGDWKEFNDLAHHKGCPMGDLLNPDGSFK